MATGTEPTTSGGAPSPGAADAPEFKAAEFDTREPVPAGSIQDAHLEVILDVPVTLAMEVGRTRMPIRELLALNPGSVVKLERLVGDPMDILVNGTLVAKGEVVVVGEQFGIRIAEVVSPEERVKSLR